MFAYDRVPSSSDMSREPDHQAPFVLFRVTAASVRLSSRPGKLAVYFPDARSDTGQAFMLVEPDEVRQALYPDGSPVAGAADVVISRDGITAQPYFLIQGDRPVAVTDSVSVFLQAHGTDAPPQDLCSASALRPDNFHEKTMLDKEDAQYGE